MKRNFFIAFEGLDGSGKSTQVKLLADKLASLDVKVYTTSEPTDSSIGRLIRDIFRHEQAADHKTIAALFVADRLDHLLNQTNGILKKIEQGYTVITDRYYFSSYAYHGTHMDMNWVVAANSLSAALLRPDLTIYIDVPPELSMKRLNARRNGTELYETMDNLERVKKKYFEAFELLKEQERVFITNGTYSKAEIAKNIWSEISRLAQFENTLS